MNFRTQLAGVFTAITLSFGLGGQAVAQNTDAAKDLIRVNIGGPSAGYWNTYLAQELGMYKKHGIDARFHWFTSGAPLLAAMKSGSIDQAVTGLAIVFAVGQNIPLKIVSWEVDNSRGEGLLVRDGTGIESYKDIQKAKTIAAMPGTCSQVSLYVIANKLGIDVDDLNVVNLAPPLFANAFMGGSIDAAIGWAPHSLMQGADVKMVSWDEDYGGVCPSLNAFRPDFVEKHPDVPLRMLRAHAETMAMVEENPQLAIDALQEYLNIPADVAQRFYELHSGDSLPTFEQQLDPDSPFSLTNPQGGLAAQLHLASQMLHDAGTIPAPLSWEVINESIDASYMKEFVSQQAATQ